MKIGKSHWFRRSNWYLQSETKILTSTSALIIPLFNVSITKNVIKYSFYYYLISFETEVGLDTLGEGVGLNSSL